MPSSPSLGAGAGHGPAPKRALSLRKSLEKVGEVLHLHKEPSARKLFIPDAKHGCRSEEEAKALRHLLEDLQAQNITVPPDMIYAGDLDATLLRFLRARKLDNDATVAMLKGCIAWRKENNIDKVLQSPLDPKKLEIIRRHKPSSYIGFDKLGRPIYVDRVGQLDIHACNAAGVTDADVITYHIQEMEYMGRVLLKEASERAGHTVDSVVMILDVAGLRLSALTGPVKTLFQQLVAIDQNNYPETNGGTYVVGASMVFTSIWAVIRHFLDKGTASKVQVLGHGKKAEAQLLEIFGEDRLPTFLGGGVQFDSARVEWGGKMDTALEEAGRRARDLEQRKERRHSTSRTASLPGTPTSRSASFSTADTVAAAAAIAEGGAPWKSRRASSSSQASTPIAATTPAAATFSHVGASPTSSLVGRTDSRGAGSSTDGAAGGGGPHPPRPSSPFGSASASSATSGGHGAVGPGGMGVGMNGVGGMAIPQGLAPIRLERVSAESEYEDADEFYTPKSNLSRSSSTSSAYADALDISLEGFGSSTPTRADLLRATTPTRADMLRASTPTRADLQKTVAAINARDKDVTNVPSSPPPAKAPGSELGTIDEQREAVVGARKKGRKQPQCKCSIM